MAVFTKIANSFVRILQWLGTMYCIGTGSYYIYKLSKGHHTPDAKAIFTVAAAGSSFVYVSFMLLLQLCLMQKTFFKMLTLLCDLIFMGAYITIAILFRGISGEGCRHRPNTPSPTWWNDPWSGARYSTRCRLTKAYWGDAIGLAGLFAISALVALLAKPSKSTRYDDTGATTTNNRKGSRAGLLPFGRRNKAYDTRPSVDTAGTRDMNIDEEKASTLGGGGGATGGQTYGRTAPTLPAIATSTVDPVPAANPPRLTSRNNTTDGGLAAPAPVGKNRAASPMSSLYEDNHRGTSNEYYPPAQANNNNNTYNAYNPNTNAAAAAGGQTYTTSELAAANYDERQLGNPDGHIDHHVGGLVAAVHQQLGLHHE